MAITPAPRPDCFLFHDYETGGINPVIDAPTQFAAIRTDAELNPLDEGSSFYARLPPDYLPQPEACLLTGIQPEHCQQHGLPQPDFMRRILALMTEQPNTCVLGYNSLRFDDEVTRHNLYRNLLDPYQREYGRGNSRWDLIDLCRMLHAVRPETLTWPRRDDGQSSMKLEQLALANGLEHGQAHDALSDVRATIALARLIRERAPRAWSYALDHRGKQQAAALLPCPGHAAVLHVSGRYPADLGHCAPVIALAPHPGNRNEYIVWDLRHDPQELEGMDVERIRLRLFTRNEELQAMGLSRLPIKTVRLNRCPMLVPMATLRPAEAERWGIVPQHISAHLSSAHGLASQVSANLGEAHLHSYDGEDQRDIDHHLYGSAFLTPHDKHQQNILHQQLQQGCCPADFHFDTAELQQRWERLRARWYPHTLSPAEQERWERIQQQRLVDGCPGMLTRQAFQQAIDQLRAESSHEQGVFLDQLGHFGQC